MGRQKIIIPAAVTSAALFFMDFFSARKRDARKFIWEDRLVINFSHSSASLFSRVLIDGVETAP